MSSLPPSSTPSTGDDSAPATPLLPEPADAAPQSSIAPAAAAETEPAAAPACAELTAADPAGAADAAATESTDAPAAAPDCGPQLKQLFPALFSNPPKPLKLRIQADIQARAPGQFTKPQLSAFLRRYTGSHAYLNAIVKATHRFDLDGNPGDALSDEHRQAAVDELARRRTNTQARRALEDEQRFNRSILLRDFEVTKLDKAGFAALKGVPEGELDGLLERARKEAAETPPPAANRDRRGPPNRGPRDGKERNAGGPRGARPPRESREPRPADADGAAPVAADGAAAAPQRVRPDAPRGPKADAPRRPRPEGERDRGPRPDGARGPQGARPEGQRGPRPDAPRGARDDRPRGPRRDDDRAPRPNVAPAPSAPTAMALAFGALRGLTTTPSTPAAPKQGGGKSSK